MIQPAVAEVSQVFRGELSWMFGPYPALIPQLGWPSVGILDALCRGMRGRRDWTESEKLFIAGAAAHLGELVNVCWERFADDVRVEYIDGIVCSARGADGSTYRLPLEQALTATLQDPDTLLKRNLAPRSPLGLPFRPRDGGHLMELFGLSTCLAISPLGEGPWAELRIDELTDHIEAVAPFLARTCAEHYARLHPDEPLGQKADLYQRLIWPLTLCDSYEGLKEAAANTLAFLDGVLAVIRGALPLLRNLARFPSAMVRGSALTCLILDERVSLSGELVEVAADHFRGRAQEFRSAAIELAAERGRNIDWLNGGLNAAARFRFEKQLSLIPLVHLPFEMAVDPRNRELVQSLVDFEEKHAAQLLERKLRENDRSPELLFQQAMLRRRLGDPEEAESLLAQIVRVYPENLDGEFYLEAGEGALALDRLDDAIARLERARSLASRRYRVSTTLGRAYAKAGRREEAAAMFGEAIAQGHLPSEVLVDRAELHKQMGQQEGYSRDLAAAAALHPFNPRVVERVMASYVNA
jgi:pentatricopeptide repeat protein